jgi:hypothetical protein
MDCKIQELIDCINQIDNLASKNSLDDNYIFSKNDQSYGMSLVKYASIIATELFITEEGKLNGENLNSFTQFEIYPIEHDTFGWLLGGIKTKKGVITFG